MASKLGYALELALVLLLAHAVKAEDEGSLRLVGGSSPNEGRLEVYINGEWGTVCSEYWSYSDASVACRQLGYSAISSYDISISSGSSSQRIWLDRVGCSGSESKLIYCRHRGFGVHDCSHSEDVGISCTGTSVRLVGGNTMYEGRVEMYYSGQWHSVCSTSSFETDEATAVCRQLGYEYVNRTTTYHGFNTTSATISCSGNQKSVNFCKIGSSSCSSSYQQYVVCSPSSTSNQYGDVRLVGGPTSGEGQVEVYYNGQWQAACGYSSFSEESKIICRQLGYGVVNEIKAQYRSRSTQGVTIICSGGQDSLRGCRLSSTTCSSQLAVMCSNVYLPRPLALIIFVPLVCGLVVLCLLYLPCCVACRLYLKKNSVVSSPRQASVRVRYIGSGSGAEARVDYPTLPPDQPDVPAGPSSNQEQLTGGPPSYQELLTVSYGQ